MNGADLRTELARLLGYKFVSDDTADLAVYCRDVRPRNLLRLQRGELANAPQAVVWPRDEAEVQAVVRYASAAKIPIIPLGGAPAAALGSRGIVVDLKRLDRILEIDEKSLTVTAEPGIVGEMLERRLNVRGYTLGHFPSSISCSSYGDMLSSRAAGQLSGRYGKIEDMVLSLRAVLPDGSIFETPLSPIAGPGPDWNHAFVGAEGTLGLMTRATCRIWPYPASRLFQAYSFNSPEDGFEAIRRMMQAELRPAAIRLYDPVDTFFSRGSQSEDEMGGDHNPRVMKPQTDRGIWSRRLLPLIFKPSLVNPLLGRLSRSKLVLTFEGDPEITRLTKSHARGLCAQAGGHDLGEDPAMQWWNHRSKVSYPFQYLFDLGLFIDIIEVSTVWDNLANLYFEMREAIAQHAFVMAHFSHAYEQGCSIYFSIAATGRNVEEKLAVHDRVWNAALQTCLEQGGAISYHHGVGVLKAKWLRENTGGSLPLLVALKDAVDPFGIMNPGKLGLAPAADCEDG